MRFIILLLSFLVSPAMAGQVSISLPGQTYPCQGSDTYFMFMQTCPSGPFPNSSYPSAFGCSSTPGGAPTGGGGWSWPTTMTIWKVGYTVIVSDPTAQSEVGILGAGGDLVTPTMIGQGMVESNHLPNGRAFTSSSDRFDFHVMCATGRNFTIQGQVEYSTP